VYEFRTEKGTFSIVLHKPWWHAVYQGESLGQYLQPEQAANGLSRGQTFSPSNGVKPATLNIPRDLTGWQLVETPSNNS
jgi:hypothetical protein